MSWSNKVITLLTTFFLCLFLICACSNQEEKKTNFYQRGIEYAKADNTNAAILEFRNAIKIDPKFAEARYQLGLLYIKSGELKKALQEFVRTATLMPNNIDAQFKAAELLFIGNSAKDCRKHIKKIIAIDATFSEAYSLLASLEFVEEKLDNAQAAINKAIELNPQITRYYLVQSRVYDEQKNYDAAEKSIQKAIKLDHGNISNHQALVKFYISRQNEELAEKTLKNIITFFPTEPGPQIDLAEFYMNTGRTDAVEKLIKNAIKIDPNSNKLLVIQANFYRKKKLLKQAEEKYMLAISKSKKPNDVKAMLADLHTETRNFSLAKQEMTEILKKDSSHPLANLVKVKLLLQEKKITEALTLTNKLVKDFPRWGEAYYQKALAHLGKNEVDMSHTAINQALKYSPNNSKIRSLSAHHLFLKREFKAAIKEARTALLLDRNNFQAATILGKSFLSSGETQEALRLFEDMEKQAPTNIEILYNKATAFIAMKNYAKAVETLEHSLSLKPDFSPALITLSALTLQTKKLTQAIARVQKQLEIVPEQPEYLILLANLLQKEPRPNQEKILSLLRHAQALIPKAPQPYLMIAQLLTQMDKTNEAITEYRNLLKENQNLTVGHMALGSLLEKTGDIPGAIASYKKALAIDPDFAPAANNLAWHLSQGEEADLGEALRLALLAKEKMPNNPRITDTLGWIHYKRGSFRLALTQFTLAAERQVNNPTIHYHLALALQGDGQLEQAKKELETCLKTKQHFPEKKAAQKLLAELS